MAISKALNNKLNEQITSEFYSAQVYLAMACTFAEQGFQMLAKLYRKQTEEEREHALKILDYLPTVEGKVKLGAIDEPPAKYPSVLAAIEAALQHERDVTAQFDTLMALAEKEKDYATCSFLRWFVDEQVEEVGSQLHLAQIARLAGNNLLQLEAYVAHLVNK